MLCIVNTGKRKKRKENVSDGTSSSNSNNDDVISVEHVEVKGKQQQQTNCDGNSPKIQEHSMIESENRFVKFEFKQNSFHN